MKILASFDDGTVEDLRVADLLNKYEIPAIFYFPVYPEVVNERHGRKSLNNEQRHEVANLFEIGSHTLTHPLLTRVATSLAAHEIEVSRKLLQEEFGQDINSFCYPRGYSNPELQMMVKLAGYTSARSTLVGHIHESENPYFIQTTVHVACNRKEYGGMQWLDYAKKMLDEAIKTPGSIYYLFGHSWEINQNEGWHDFEDLLKDINENTSS